MPGATLDPPGPYRPRMSETPGLDLAELERLGQVRDPIDRTRVVRDVASVALVGAGTTGLVVTGFLVAPLLGLAALSTAIIAVGLVLARG